MGDLRRLHRGPAGQRPARDGAHCHGSGHARDRRLTVLAGKQAGLQATRPVYEGEPLRLPDVRGCGYRTPGDSLRGHVGGLHGELRRLRQCKLASLVHAPVFDRYPIGSIRTGVRQKGRVGRDLQWIASNFCSCGDSVLGARPRKSGRVVRAPLIWPL